MEEQSLKEKTVKGVGWSAIDSVSGFAVTFVVGLILARLLSPEDYGLLGIIAVFTAVCNSFINGGFWSALVRKKDATEADYSTVFITNLCTALFFYAVLFVSAPWIAEFFNRHELIALVRVSSIEIIMGSLALVQGVRVIKKIDFKTRTVITLSSAIVRGVVGISMAYAGFGVWALVAQEVVGTTTQTILYWGTSKWVPHTSFSKESFRELFGFGYKLLISRLIDTVWKEIYQVVIGKFYAPATLGQYTRATGFCNMFSANLTGIVQNVSYPVLSQIQDDLPRLKDAYRRIIRTTMLVTFFCMLMLVAVAKPLIIVLLGMKWLQAVVFLQIICLSGMLYPLHAINLNMLQIQGRSDLFLKLEIIKKAVALGPILLGIFFDIYWMLWGSVITGVFAYYLNAYYSGPFLLYSIAHQIRDIAPSFLISTLSSLIAFIPSYLIDLLWNGENWKMLAFVVLPVQLVVGIVSFIILCRAFKLSEYYELRAICLQQYQKLRINYYK